MSPSPDDLFSKDSNGDNAIQRAMHNGALTAPGKVVQDGQGRSYVCVGHAAEAPGILYVCHAQASLPAPILALPGTEIQGWKPEPPPAEPKDAP